MPDAFHAEFTGERVIPGRVEENLFNEHLARYRFAARLATAGQTILDAGCGAGYGAAELARTGADVLGIDISQEAIEHARAHYAAASHIRFEQASCTAMPAGDAGAHLITAFEVIEHLTDWRAFLEEAHRVLHPSGVFLVSTPNRLYYTESREKAGPNPFHVHEFTEEEFRSELSTIFPHVKMLLQNHVEGVAFSGAVTEGQALEVSERPDDPASAHFFLAVCGKQPLPAIARFVFIPDAGNVLQTRERHIALLEGEIRQKNQWIEVEKVERGRMQEKVRTLEAELEEHTCWAQQANHEAERRAKLVAELQAELHKSNEWAQARDAEAVERGRRVEQLQAEVAQSTAWARERDAEAEERAQRIVDLQAELAEATAWAQRNNAETEARSARIVELQEEIITSSAGYEAAIDQWRRDKAAADQWAIDIDRRLSEEVDTLRREVDQLTDHLNQANSRLEMIAQSRWVRMGRVIRIGPEIART